MDKILETNRVLDRIVSSIGDLPATPVIVTTLMSLTADINSDIDKICKAIMADQALTARVLKLSNSSFYGRAKEVGTLKEAIMLLGFKTLRSLVVASSTHSLYQNVADTTFRDKLWEHTYATALAARMITKKTRLPYLEESFIAGLMHDIGKLVMMQKVPKDYKKIVMEVERDGLQFNDVEDRELGFNHTDVGLLLLHKWSFPELLGNAVYEHHHPIKPDEGPLPLSFVIYAANFMAKNLDIGFSDHKIADLSEAPLVAALGLEPEELRQIQDELAVRFEDECSIFTVRT